MKPRNLTVLNPIMRKSHVHEESDIPDADAEIEAGLDEYYEKDDDHEENK